MQQEALSFLSSTFPSRHQHHHFPPFSRLRFHNFPALSFKPDTSSSSSLFFPPQKSPDFSSFPSTTETLETDIHEKLLYLDSLGIDFLTLINRHPPLLSAALSTVKSVVDYMTIPPINFSLPDFRRLVSMCPELLTSPLTSHTIPVITFLLREVGVDSVFDLRQALRRRPRLLAFSIDFNSTKFSIASRIEPVQNITELLTTENDGTLTLVTENITELFSTLDLFVSSSPALSPSSPQRAIDSVVSLFTTRSSPQRSEAFHRRRRDDEGEAEDSRDWSALSSVVTEERG